MIRVVGVDKAVMNLNKNLSEMRNVTVKGMVTGGMIILREAQKNTPVDTGNLRAGGFIIWSGGRGATSPTFSNKKKGQAEAARSHAQSVSDAKSIVSGGNQMNPKLMVGFSASYAFYVHENLEAHHGGAKPRATGKKIKFGKLEIDEFRMSGRAKFLEAAINENAGAFLDAVESAGKRAL